MTRESATNRPGGTVGGHAFGIIGGGTMGETICRSLLQNGLGAPDQIIVCEVNARRGETLRASLSVAITKQAAEAAAGVPVIFLAVKPQDFPAVAQGLQGLILPEQLVVSIMAGVSLHSLRDLLGHRAVVRAMPNTPAQLGHGMTVWTASNEVTEAQRTQVRTLLATMGREIAVPDERQVDMATAVSGSGPGFLFLFFEALIRRRGPDRDATRVSGGAGLPDRTRIRGPCPGVRLAPSGPARHGGIARRHNSGRIAHHGEIWRPRGHHRSHCGGVPPHTTAGAITVDDALLLIGRVIEIYQLVLLARVIMSWIPLFTRRPLDYSNPLIKILLDVTEPLLAPIRRFAVIGMIDLSPLIALITLSVISRVLIGAASS